MWELYRARRQGSPVMKLGFALLNPTYGLFNVSGQDAPPTNWLIAPNEDYKQKLVGRGFAIAVAVHSFDSTLQLIIHSLDLSLPVDPTLQLTDSGEGTSPLRWTHRHCHRPFR